MRGSGKHEKNGEGRRIYRRFGPAIVGGNAGRPGSGDPVQDHQAQVFRKV